MAEDFESDQRELAQLWKKARKDGCMSPWQQAKVFGLKEAWQEMHGDKKYGQVAWTTERVYVQGHPQKHPSDESVRKLLKHLCLKNGLPPREISSENWEIRGKSGWKMGNPSLGAGLLPRKT